MAAMLVDTNENDKSVGEFIQHGGHQHKKVKFNFMEPLIQVEKHSITSQSLSKFFIKKKMPVDPVCEPIGCTSHEFNFKTFLMSRKVFVF